MKLFFKIFSLITIDFVLIWSYVYYIDPGPSISIGILILGPFVFILNLIISVVFFLVKKREFAKIFLLNSIVASFMMSYLFRMGIERHQNKRLESWEFHNLDTNYRLTRWKKTNEFDISIRFNNLSSTGFLHGTCELKNNHWILKTDSKEMKIINNYLIGFNSKADTIKMKKLKR